MTNNSERHAESMGMLAIGSSGQWQVTVDEVLDREEWFLEIEGPQTYLVFQLRDLHVLFEAVRLLEAEPGITNRQREEAEATLVLGRFGSSEVSLVWDNEDLPRCFIIVGPDGVSAFRIALGAADIQMLTDALRQVVKDLPQTVAT